MEADFNRKMEAARKKLDYEIKKRFLVIFGSKAFKGNDAYHKWND